MNIAAAVAPATLPGLVLVNGPAPPAATAPGAPFAQALGQATDMQRARRAESSGPSASPASGAHPDASASTGTGAGTGPAEGHAAAADAAPPTASTRTDPATQAVAAARHAAARKALWRDAVADMSAAGTGRASAHPGPAQAAAAGPAPAATAAPDDGQRAGQALFDLATLMSGLTPGLSPARETACGEPAAAAQAQAQLAALAGDAGSHAGAGLPAGRGSARSGTADAAALSATAAAHDTPEDAAALGLERGSTLPRWHTLGPAASGPGPAAALPHGWNAASAAAAHGGLAESAALQARIGGEAVSQALALAAPVGRREAALESLGAAAAPLGGLATLVPARPGEAATPFQAELHAALGTAEFAPALGAQLSLLVRDGIEHAQLKLNPAELGPIEVRISLNGTQAQVDFSAAQAGTRQSLQDAVPALASALRESGLTLTGGGVFEQPRDSRGEPRQEPPRHSPASSDGVPGAPGTGRAALHLSRARGVVDLYA